MTVGNKRVTLFAGHYGSGKTNVALNYARRLRAGNRAVTVVDLDIVNPYFRTKDSAAALAAEGIDLVVSEFANSNVDFPALPKEIYSVLSTGIGESANRRIDELPLVVCDVGGDDRGALALGRYAPDVIAENDYEMLGVINASRPLTRTPADAVEVLREIEAASSGLKFTGLVNNTNFGQESKASDVLASLDYAAETSALAGLPVRFTCCAAALAPELAGRVPDLFPLEIQKLYYQLS